MWETMTTSEKVSFATGVTFCSSILLGWFVLWIYTLSLPQAGAPPINYNGMCVPARGEVVPDEMDEGCPPGWAPEKRGPARGVTFQPQP